MSTFEFEPSPWVPFRDRQAIERCRRIPRSHIAEHPNGDFRIRVVADEALMGLWLDDMFERIRLARESGRPCVMLLPNPWPGYRELARRINESRLDCRHVWMFAMDEYADQDGRAAPDDWPYGFLHAMLTFLWEPIDPALRPPRRQVVAPSHGNVDHYLGLMEDAGGLDISYTGPGWTGHLAFCEPDAPEFGGGRDVSLAEWRDMGARVCTLSPFTIAQNSLHGCFGASGDLAAVPPKACTIGPREIIAARHRWEMASITVAGTGHSWQRMIARLCYHGPVTPRLPSSLHQTLRTDCMITESVAADIRSDWSVGY
ncbi:MAG: hypothetical protein GX591_09185 [Planctomycetes bacterium]|nr:hypothetical protein [Planctomycetota bacterium]